LKKRLVPDRFSIRARKLKSEMSRETKFNIAMDALSNSNSNSKSYGFTVSARNSAGKFLVEWKFDAVWRPVQSQVVLYKGDTLPKNPNSTYVDWQWVNSMQGSWDSSTKWGDADWVAIVAKDYNGNYHYVVTLKKS
jgi:hypothetical protein